LVSAHRYEYLSQWNWHAKISKDNGFYASRNEWIDGKCVNFSMHRVILGVPDGVLVDHKDRDKLNNQDWNLRQATEAQNQWNREKSVLNTTGYRGVSFKPSHNKYQAQITANGKKYWIGYYDTPELAAAAYIEKARELHGEFSFQ